MDVFEKIIGYEAIKSELRQIADVLKNTERYRALGAKAPGGLLLNGEPGVGKTLMANCLAAASGRKIFLCRKDQPNGEFTRQIKKTFTQARESAPSIVFLDDMDKFANGDEAHRDAEEYVTVQSCIDEVRDVEVFVIATTNGLGHLPRSLLRAGRFDRIIELRSPTGKDAEQIVAHYLGKKHCATDLDPVTVARLLHGNSCAELESVINEAKLYAGFDRAETVGKEHFLKACLHQIYEVPLELLNAGKQNGFSGFGEKNYVVYHEAGHAVIREALCPGTVTLVSALGRRREKHGFTAFCDEETRSGSQLERIEQTIIGALGGLAAVEQVFGIFDLGADNDLQKAHDTIERMIESAGLHGFAMIRTDYGSEVLRARIEDLIATDMEHYYRMAKEILVQNADFLHALAKELAARGVLCSEDVARIRLSCPARRKSV